METSSKPMSMNRMLINTAYFLFVLFGAFGVSLIVGLIVGWIVPPQELSRSGGNMAFTYYVSFSVRGIVMLAAFLISVRLFSHTHGYKVAFSLREEMSKNDFLFETIAGCVVFFGISWWLFHESLFSWYLSGTLASLFGIVKASDLFGMEFGGTGFESGFTLQKIALYYYVWLQLILDVLALVGASVLAYRGRRSGELHARQAHEKQLAEMRKDSGLDP